MDALIASYSALSTAAVAGIQRIGVLSIPLVIGLAATVNYFGGERAIRAVGVAIAVVAVLAIILSNAVALGNWIAAPSIPAGAAGVPRP